MIRGQKVKLCCVCLHNQTKDNNKFKNKNNQNCQKIKLYGSPTTKELKKKHSSRLVGGAEMGSQGRKDSKQGCGWRTRVGKVTTGGPSGPTLVCG